MRSLCFQIRLVILLGFLLSPGVYAGQKAHYQFEKGKVYKYSTTVESKTAGQMMGQEFSMTSGAALDYSLTAAEVKDGVYTLILTFDKFHVKINMPMMGFTDSTIVMDAYVGKRMKVVVTERGKTISTALIDTIAPSRIQAMANLTPMDLFKQLLLELPEKPLDNTSAWKKDIPDTTQRGGVKIVTKNNIQFKVAGAEKKNGFDCLKLTMSGTNIIEGSGSQRGNDVAIDGTNKINGSVFFAPSEGLFVLSEQSNESDMTTTVTGSQTGASTMSISTKMKTEFVK
jgi:hypothetical protein